MCRSRRNLPGVLLFSLLPVCSEQCSEACLYIYFKDVQSSNRMFRIEGVQTVALMSYPEFALNLFFPQKNLIYTFATSGPVKFCAR
jgi:hypothetical protein